MVVDDPRPNPAQPPTPVVPDALEQHLRDAIGGQAAAFAALYTDVHPRLRRYARTLVGQDADDVTAEAWLQIARDLRAFRGDLDSFRGWSARIVRNRAMDHLRHHARRPSQPVAELPDAASGDDTAELALEHLGTERAVDLIATLPREQAEAVMLRAVVGLDAKHAALVLGKTPEAVRTSAHRGLRRLADRLGGDR